MKLKNGLFAGADTQDGAITFNCEDAVIRDVDEHRKAISFRVGFAAPNGSDGDEVDHIEWFDAEIVAPEAQITQFLRNVRKNDVTHAEGAQINNQN